MKIEYNYYNNTKVTFYNVEDEEPDCMRCLHCCDGDEVCEQCKRCGWAYYERPETEEFLTINDIKYLFK